MPIDVATKQQVQPTKTRVVKSHKHNRPLISCRFHPDGQHVFFGAQDNRVWRWNIQTNDKAEFAGHDSWIRAMAFAEQGKLLLTGGYDGRLIWWNALDKKPKPVRTIEAHQGWIRAIAVSPDGSMVASAGNDLAVKFWTIADGKTVRSMTGHASHIYNVAFHPNGDDLCTGDLKAKLIHWDVASGAKKREFTAASLHKYDTGFRADIGGPRCMDFNTDGSLLACGGITNVTNAFAGVGNPSVELIDWKTGKRHVQYLSKAKLRGVAWGVAQHPYGFTIGLSGGGGGGHLLFFKEKQANEFHTLKMKDTGRDLSLSPDLIHIATAHHDSQLRISKMAAK